ncbi:ribonuclease P protein component [Candidatus Phytoplasma melaleucae]|uniref:Ribonuclease P protein component n=1 Tax=Candidatus Phytoplasma melaleucae TaxID=2982630 RepID=A0ABT9DEM4_9MOLU|nr:ribonuclease P protein component ['Melaleuca sp.' phytoplasma]MDO8168263.1 ribonuclease P protein component ['Melaleuca sp.' phytoplasma]MDV3205439.1 ribonuclease P protein component [Weeping tea tree witches'-broom phytoplasma]
MKRKFILRKNSEINLIFRSNKNHNVKNAFFTLFYVKHVNTLHFKFTLSISKKYGKAHERNLIKRRLRMIIYNYSKFIDSSVYFAVVIKPKAKELNFANLTQNLLMLLQKSSLIT